MNNFILSFIFLICLIFYYILVGSFFLTKIKIEKNKFAVYVIVGWLITFALGWITGFPAQLNSKSWSYFAQHFQIALVIIGLLSLIGNTILKKREILYFCKSTKEKPILLLKYLLDHIEKYWFVYLFVGFFTWFSITNMQPYTLCNYTDDHYIVKMVNNLKINALLTEDVTGNPLHSYNKFGYAIQFSHRMFNTYEIVYTYFSSLFGINVVTFARFAMTIHNYLIWFLAYQLLGSIYVDGNKSQYTILFFIFLIIPEGYAARGMKLIKIRIFENWRNQTAIYMGGSIVRNLTFPIFIYFTNLIFEKKIIMPLLLFAISFISLISFQTTSLSYFIIYLPLLLLGILIYFLWSKFNFQNLNLTKLITRISISVVAVLTILVGMRYVDEFISKLEINGNTGAFKLIVKWFTLSKGINVKALTAVYKSYIPYYNNVFKLDSFAKVAPIVLIALFILSKNLKSRVSTLVIALIFMIFKLNKMKLTLSLVSFEFFGTARMLNSMILLIIFVCGVLIIDVIELIQLRISITSIRKLIIPCLSLSLVIGIVSFININMENIVRFNKKGDGIIKKGYSLFPVINNDKMLFQTFCDVGNYFNKLPGKRYCVYSFEYFKIDGLKYSKQNLLLSSNKIATSTVNFYSYRLAVNNQDSSFANMIMKQNNANWWLDKYLLSKKNKVSYEPVKKALNESNIQYAFFTEYKYVDSLVKHNWKIVLGNRRKGYWILKRQ